MSEGDDGIVELKRAYDFYHELPVNRIIYAKELIPALNRSTVLYLIGETNMLERRLVYLMLVEKSLIYEPAIAVSVLGIPKSPYYWPRRLRSSFSSSQPLPVDY